MSSMSVEICDKLLNGDKYTIARQLCRLNDQDFRAVFEDGVRNTSERILQLLDYVTFSDILDRAELVLHVISFLDPKAFVETSQINRCLSHLVHAQSRKYFADYVFVMCRRKNRRNLIGFTPDITFGDSNLSELRMANYLPIFCNVVTLKHQYFQLFQRVCVRSSITLNTCFTTYLLKMQHLKILDIRGFNPNTRLTKLIHFLNALPQSVNKLTHFAIQTEDKCTFDPFTLFNLFFSTNCHPLQLQCLNFDCTNSSNINVVQPMISCNTNYSYRHLRALKFAGIIFDSKDLIQNIFDNLQNLNILSIANLKIGVGNNHNNNNQTQLTKIKLPRNLIALQLQFNNNNNNNNNSVNVNVTVADISLQNCDQLIFLAIDTNANLDRLLEQEQEQEMHSHIAPQMQCVMFSFGRIESESALELDLELELHRIQASIETFDLRNLSTILYLDEFCAIQMAENKRRIFTFEVGSEQQPQSHRLDIRVIQQYGELDFYYRLFEDEDEDGQMYESLRLLFR